MKFSEILKSLRKNKRITQTELANMLNVSKSTIGMYETGQREPNFEILEKLSSVFSVSIDYLLGNSPNPSPDVTIIPGIFPLKTKKLPIMGDIACGKPIFAEESYDGYIDIEEGINADFCLRAKGDSMIGARIMDGDIVMVKKQDMVQNGEIAVVLIDDEATLKRAYFYPDKNKLILNPENPKYEPLVFIGEELNSIHILGKAVAFQSVIR
ncbi:MAG: helix-turn-helix domain-containing protein [Clostridia bacterium]|nr:helix-turn-helix domain-containing protein [Clostridia bacterium]